MENESGFQNQKIPRGILVITIGLSAWMLFWFLLAFFATLRDTVSAFHELSGLNHFNQTNRIVFFLRFPLSVVFTLFFGAMGGLLVVQFFRRRQWARIFLMIFVLAVAFLPLSIALFGLLGRKLEDLLNYYVMTLPYALQISFYSTERAYYEILLKLDPHPFLVLLSSYGAMISALSIFFYLLWSNKTQAFFSGESEIIRNELSINDSLQLLSAFPINRTGEKTASHRIISFFNYQKTIVIILFIFTFIFFFATIRTPHYSSAQTIEAERRLQVSITGTPLFVDVNRRAFELLQNRNPALYQRAVNVIDWIRFDQQLQPGALYRIVDGKPNGGIVVPNSFKMERIKTQDDLYAYTALIVHEANHLEYFRSSPLRQTFLTAKCAAFFNPDLLLKPIFSTDFYHQVVPLELCAIREQENFLKSVRFPIEAVDKIIFWY